MKGRLTSHPKAYLPLIGTTIMVIFAIVTLIFAYIRIGGPTPAQYADLTPEEVELAVWLSWFTLFGSIALLVMVPLSYVMSYKLHKIWTVVGLSTALLSIPILLFTFFGVIGSVLCIIGYIRWFNCYDRP